MVTSRITRQHGTRRGLTVVEAVVSTLVVGIMLVAALSTLGASARSQYVQSTGHHARTLARQIMSEVLVKAFTEPEYEELSYFGPDGAEWTPANRVLFDDVDDFHGWARTPPEQPSGAVVPGYDGWTRSVVVHRATIATPDVAVSPSTQTGLNRIVVTVTDLQGRPTTLTALRSNVGAVSPPARPDRPHSNWMGAGLQVGPASTARLGSGVPLLNVTSPVTPNLLTNGTMEDGVTDWFAFGLLPGGATLTADSVNKHGGRSCLSVTGRVDWYYGAAQSVTGALQNGTTYEFQAWVRMATTPSTVILSMNVADSLLGNSWLEAGSTPVGTEWTRVSGRFTPVWNGSLVFGAVKVRTASGVDDFLVDDAVLREVP